MSNHKTNNSRRDFLLKSMTLIPAAVIGGSGVGALTAPAPAVAASNTSTQNDYQPTFFTPEEWAFIKAAVARLIPADERGPGALEAGVPEFIDRQMNTPYATGSIWYMQGPFNPDVPKEMGYQLPLVPKQIYNLGIADADAYSKKTAGKPFAELDGAQQDAVLPYVAQAAVEVLPGDTKETLHERIKQVERELSEVVEARDDDDIAALEQGPCRRQPHPIDLVVDRGFFLDIRVTGGNVGFGLVVVVIADEVLDRVFRKEPSEFLIELRGQRLVVRHHQRRPMHLRQHLRHGVCLA